MIAINGDAAVRAILESHFISPIAQAILMRDPFTADDFEAFITERQKTIQQAIENLLVKERLDLPPHLRNLDEQIERVELGLRNLILTTLSGNPQKIPSQIRQKVEERIHNAARKNPALDLDDYNTLDGKLEFFDLRELQETITNKELWINFESRFINKETLNIKFTQLADLRNAIRHSRTVDEITRKEGEAGILWFEQVLKKQ